MLRKVFAVLLFVALALVVIGFLLPTTASIERSRVIDHPDESIFEVLSDFRHFVQWSPWMTGESAEDYRLEGPASGEGATLIWREHHEPGASRMWIMKTERPRRIAMQMEFGDKPASSYFRIDPNADGHEVTWGMRMEVATFDLIGRYLGVILPHLIGRSYAEGLERLEAYLATAPDGGVPSLPEGREAQVDQP